MEEIQQAILAAIDWIDEHITEEITLEEMARQAHFSVSYFSRAFARWTGISAMAYVTRRKLQHAMHALCSGAQTKILDAATEYGFETHAGFCKAFQRQFGCSPSQYRMHTPGVLPPKRGLRYPNEQGELCMQVQIQQRIPCYTAGVILRRTLPRIQGTQDIPTYWDSLQLDYSGTLTRLHRRFAQSRHCEYSFCYDIDAESGAFTYFLGVGVDPIEDVSALDPDVTLRQLPGGLFAVFTLPPTPDEAYTAAVRQLWQDIFERWLPDAGYALDEDRCAFEYYDERDHGELVQMEIVLPIRPKQA